MKFDNVKIRGMHFVRKESRIATAASVYVGYEDGSLTRLNLKGHRMWTKKEFTQPITSVLENEDRKVYVSGADGVLKKFDNDGTTIWTYTGHSSSINDMVLDRTNGGEQVVTASSDGKVNRVDNDKTLVWSFTGHSGAVHGVDVDVFGNVYTAGNDGTVKRLAYDGQSEVWSVSEHTSTINGVAVDIDGSVYSFGKDNSVVKYDGADGAVIWKFNGNTTEVVDIAVDQYGNVFTVSVDGNLRNVNSEGSEVNVVDLGAEPVGVAVDVSGYVYVGVEGTGGVRLKNDGSEVWSYRNINSEPSMVATTEQIVMFPPIISSGVYEPLLPPEDVRAI